MHTQMKALNNQNKIILNISKKSSSRRELNKIQRINKSNDDYLISNNGSVYSDSDYIYFSILFLSDQ